MKLYGSISNRLKEGHNWEGELKVGTRLTEYLWSDKHAYEITRVVDQKHIFIRSLKAVRTDNNGMSECQDYRFESDESLPEYELMFKYGKWKKVRRYNYKDVQERARLFVEEGNIKTYEAALAYVLRGMPENEINKLKSGKDVLRYSDFNNISFGVAEEYFDYSF